MMNQDLAKALKTIMDTGYTGKAGKEIRFVREFLGHSPSAMAKLTNVSETDLARWENSEEAPPDAFMGMLQTLAECFEVTQEAEEHGVTVKPSFAALLSAVEKKGEEMRALLIQANAAFLAASVEERTRLSKDEEVRRTLGAVHAHAFLFPSQYYLNLVFNAYSAVVVKESPLRGADSLGDAMSHGMARATMSCPCGSCMACKLKASRGLAIATEEIRLRLRTTIGVAQMAQQAIAKGRA